MLRSIALLLLLCQVTEAQENLGVQDLFESMPTPKYVAETPAAAEKRPPLFPHQSQRLPFSKKTGSQS